MVLPKDPKKRAAAIADRPRPQPKTPDPYPALGSRSVEVQAQGPNEQSIVASGMTVEEWQLKHPGQPLGPAPEEIGQVTTDPPDGSDPEPDPLFPGTFTSIDPDGMKTRAENEDPVFPGDGTGEVPPELALTITAPTDGATVPTVHDITGTGAAPNSQVTLRHVEIDEQVASTAADASGNWGFTGDTPAAPGPMTWEVATANQTAQVAVTVEDTPPAREGEAARDNPWDGLTTHHALDELMDDRGFTRPDKWSGMTVAAKKAWLDDDQGRSR